MKGKGKKKDVALKKCRDVEEKLGAAKFLRGQHAFEVRAGPELRAKPEMMR